jgi:hypothetical protein
MKQVFFLILTVLLISCQKENTNHLLRYSMKDGMILYTQEDVHNYENANSFLNAESNFREKPEDVVVNQDSKKDSIYGYDEILSVSWERAKFGNWIEKYNLDTKKTYFVQTIKVVKLIPSSAEYALTEGLYNDYNIDSIGVNLNTGKRGLIVSSSNINGGYEAYTIMKKIGYDDNGDSVGFYYPIKPSNIKWKYFKIKTIW